MTKARDLSSLIGSSGQIDNAKITLDVNEIPALDTAKITTGTFDASRIGSGTFSADRINNASLSNVTALPSGVGGIAWQSVQTTGFTAVAGNGYPCNTTSSAFTVTLPASPSAGDEIIIIDYAGTFDTNKLTIGRNSEKINGSAADLTVATERAANTLVYTDGTQGWLLKNN